MKNPFAPYHHARRVRMAQRIAVCAIATVLVGAVMVATEGASHPSVASAHIRTTSQLASRTESAGAVPAATPTAAPTASPAPAAPTAPSTSAHTWSIVIATTGYQHELDLCEWVRMDLGVDAPIVGAHNSCGGSIVLEMREGDTVELHGTGLDGSYLVVASRDATAGEDAAQATAGLTANVFLQTCYHGTGGRVRLVALATVVRENG